MLLLDLLAAVATLPLEPLQVDRLLHVLPWFANNALTHYLSPRGIEQYTGGGWGTRDVCQGPVEMLLALERHPELRALLLRVLASQSPEGGWGQAFEIFEIDRTAPVAVGSSTADPPGCGRGSAAAGVIAPRGVGSSAEDGNIPTPPSRATDVTPSDDNAATNRP